MLWPSPAASSWQITEKLVRRAEAAGCPALALTVDTQAGRHTETADRFKRLDNRKCVVCHGTKPEEFFRCKPMFTGMDMASIATGNPALTWEHVRRLKNLTKMKLLIKGIETREDAKLCAETAWTASWFQTTEGGQRKAVEAPLNACPKWWTARAPGFPC